MSQDIPVKWLTSGTLHPCRYHAKVMSILKRAGARGVTRSEMERRFPYILLQPQGDGIDVILRDLWSNGIALETWVTRGGSRVMAWTMVCMKPASGYFHNTLLYSDGRPILVKEPARFVKKKKAGRIKFNWK